MSEKYIFFFVLGAKRVEGSIEPRTSPVSQPHTKSLYVPDIDLILLIYVPETCSCGKKKCLDILFG